MIRCLAIGIDQANHWELNKAFRAFSDQFQILFVESGLEAINKVDFSKIAVIFCEFSHGDTLKANLKRFLEANKYTIPILLLQGDGDVKNGDTAKSSLAQQVIPRPVLPGDLAGRLLEALGKTYYQGRMSGIDFVSVLQLIELDALTCTLVLSTPSLTGYGFVFFLDGNPIDALWGRFEAEAALKQIFSHDNLIITMYNNCPLITDHLHTNCTKMIVDYKGLQLKGNSRKKAEATGLAGLFMKVKKQN